MTGQQSNQSSYTGRGANTGGAGCVEEGVSRGRQNVVALSDGHTTANARQELLQSLDRALQDLEARSLAHKHL